MAELKFYDYGPKTISEPRNFYPTQSTLHAKYLVVLLHGYGSNGENLISLAPEFAKILPNTHFIAPNGIEEWEGGFPNSYQWFSLRYGVENVEHEQLAQKIRHSNQVLKAFIESQLKKLEIDHENLILIGFSQGAMMACYQGMIAPKKIPLVLSYSGKVVLPQNVGDEIISRPKICLVHGKQDAVLDINNFVEAKKIFQEQKIPYEAYSFDDLGHSIDHRGIETGKKFIQRTLS